MVINFVYKVGGKLIFHLEMKNKQRNGNHVFMVLDSIMKHLGKLKLSWTALFEIEILILAFSLV